MNNNSNRDYATENINLKQQIMDLKKEIAELKDRVAYLKEDGEEWQSAYEWSQAQNSILKLKNQELEEENQKLKKDYNLLDTTMESDDRIICELLKEKEQLSNDIKLNETQIDDLTLEVTNYKHALEEKNEIIMDLKEEKEELEQQLAYECGCNSQLVDYQTAIEKFFDYLNKEPNRAIPKHSIKQVFDKLLKEVFGNE